ncbi:hypothetical protein G647_06823 [Cladophialophora carrionii CBS 160.54]|uniref:C2H2-type domain-containing protein n=1 Tax=Cladophialophora carrionii CBS 160.54 TaxID=1279043 RepID=V9D9V5_9EURO|nr:uncharacterized protein G647_06823 [Cladophialophora carrionii CBS 160.54]ETI22747.1 hypothetical protein G647_06823 [Cladophialophora carrionii CBS 160.54]
MANDHRAILSRLTSSASDTASNSGTILSKADSGYVTNTATSISEFEEAPLFPAVSIPPPPNPLDASQSFLCPYCALPILVGDSESSLHRAGPHVPPSSSWNTHEESSEHAQPHAQTPQKLREATVMDVATSADWATHVFADLEPYLCTSDQCLQGAKTYSTQEDWIQHELYAHHIPNVWACEACGHEWRDQTLFSEHVALIHDIPPEHMAAIASLSMKPSAKTPYQLTCPLCRLDCAFELHFKHVADHLQQFALISIDTEVPESPHPVLTSYQGDKYSDLVRFIEEQSEMSQLQQTQKDDSLTGLFQRLWNDQPGLQPASGSPSKPQLSRPRIKSRGPSYTYMQRVRELKVEEAARSAATTPLAQWRSIEPTASAHSGQGTICTLQPPWNPDFVGRIDDLAKIDDTMKEKGHITIIRGPGGMGKSAIATAYTWKFKSCFSYIFWVPAETAMICADSFCEIALKVIPHAETIAEEERLVNLAREFLEQTSERWLLVFDNVDEAFDLRRFLPADMSNTHGCVLITTRNKNLDVSHLSTGASTIDLHALKLEESRELLLKSANRGEPVEDMRAHPEYKLAGDIAKRAEKLPLALSLIAGFVLASECTLAYFVELWNERQMSRNAQEAPADADDAMEMVWNIGLREVRTDSRQLLNILAFFDSDNIQKGLLVGSHEDPSLEMLHSHSPMRWSRMTAELSKRRLITIRTHDGEEVLSIHRKLQAKILDELNQPDNAAERRKVFERVFLLIRARFPRPSPIQVPEPHKWPTCRRYLPHILSIKRLWQTGLVEIPPSVKMAELISDAGIDLWERCLTVEGLELLRSAEAILDQGDFQEDHLRANIHVVVSLLLQDSGIANLAECRDRITKVITIRVRHREECDPATYTKNDDILLGNAWSDYGCVLLQYNNYKEAAPIFDNCLEKYHEWGPPEEIPYEYAKYHHHKAYCLMYEGKFEQAVPMAEQGLHWVQVATGQSAATNRWRFDLACLVLQSGDRQRALNLHKEVLEARLKLHGKFGLLTFQSYYAVGAAHRWLGQLNEAEQYMRKVIEIDQSRPGICTEAGLAQTQFNLSEILGLRAEQVKDGGKEPRLSSEMVSALLEESAVLAQRARKANIEDSSSMPMHRSRRTRVVSQRNTN